MKKPLILLLLTVAVSKTQAQIKTGPLKEYPYTFSIDTAKVKTSYTIMLLDLKSKKTIKVFVSEYTDGSTRVYTTSNMYPSISNIYHKKP